MRVSESPKPEWIAAAYRNDPELDERQKRHWNEPHISIAQYSRSRRLSLGSEVLKRIRIYLDQKYWIYCRDASAGLPTKPVHTELWHRLCSLVDSGRIICPASFPVLIETLKQGDTQKRRATAVVIDRLSQRVAIQPCDTLAEIELLHAIRSITHGASSVYPLQQLPWTFAGWVDGETTLESAAFDKNTNTAIQKGIFDLFAAFPFEVMVDGTTADNFIPIKEDREHYSQLNKDVAAHQHEVTSFDTVFLSELAGWLDVLKPAVSSMWRYEYEKETKQPAPAAGSPSDLDSTRLFCNLIYNLYRLKKWTTEFPYVHIRSGLHATVRHRKQPYKLGDHWDHRHAHPALAYCQAFLTEKSLGSLICTRPLKLDSEYNCRVMWDDDAIIEYLRSLA